MVARAAPRPIPERPYVLLLSESLRGVQTCAAQLAASGVETLISDARTADGMFDPLESITELLPSVTVLELGEPYLDVWPFTLARRQEPTLHPVVAVTATAPGARSLQGLVSAVLGKPVSTRALCSAVLRVLASQPPRTPEPQGPRTESAACLHLPSGTARGLKEAATLAAGLLGVRAAAIVRPSELGKPGGAPVVLAGDPAFRWDSALLDHAAGLPVPVLLGDVRNEASFRNVPSVTRGTVRFLASTPLRVSASGPSMGTLVLCDPRPRGPAHDDAFALRTLGERLAVELMAHVTAEAQAKPVAPSTGSAELVERPRFVETLQAELQARGHRLGLLWIRKESRDDVQAPAMRAKVEALVARILGRGALLTVYDDNDIAGLLRDAPRARSEEAALALQAALDEVVSGAWKVGLAIGRATDNAEALVARAVRVSRGERTVQTRPLPYADTSGQLGLVGPPAAGGTQVRGSAPGREPPPMVIQAAAIVEDGLPANTVVDGRYRLLYEIGRGGMGIVYLAEEVRLRRHVAVKVLRPEVASEPLYRDHFLREGVLLAAIDHQSVLPIYAVGEHERLPFLVTPFIDGESLADRLEAVQRGGVPAPSSAEVARICRDIAAALAALHQKGIVHRDVKPSNILLRRQSDRVLLCDFGVAVQLDEGALRGRLVAGTLGFIAPEVLKDPNAVSAQTDIYALGAVGLCLTTGANPFIGDDINSTLARQMSVPPVKHDDSTDGGLLSLLSWLVQPAQLDRPKNCEEVERAFDSIRIRLLAPARSATPTPPRQTPAARHGDVTSWARKHPTDP
jgi:hypothetical protein